MKKIIIEARKAKYGYLVRINSDIYAADRSNG